MLLAMIFKKMGVTDTINGAVEKKLSSVQPTENLFCPHSPEKNMEWEDWGLDHCFMVVSERQVGIKALYSCLILGGHQVSIHNAAEHQIIVSHLNKSESVWIGLHQTVDGYEWSDGSPLDYVNWNDEHHVEDRCVELLAESGLWNDIHCDSYRYTLCAADKVPGNKEVTSREYTISIQEGQIASSSGLIALVAILGVTLGATLLLLVLYVVRQRPQIVVWNRLSSENLLIPNSAFQDSSTTAL